jgi:hypothetical protein
LSKLRELYDRGKRIDRRQETDLHSPS